MAHNPSPLTPYHVVPFLLAWGFFFIYYYLGLFIPPVYARADTLVHNPAMIMNLTISNLLTDGGLLGFHDAIDDKWMATAIKVSDH